MQITHFGYFWGAWEVHALRWAVGPFELDLALRHPTNRVCPKVSGCFWHMWVERGRRPLGADPASFHTRFVHTRYKQRLLIGLGGKGVCTALVGTCWAFLRLYIAPLVAGSPWGMGRMDPQGAGVFSPGNKFR